MRRQRSPHMYLQAMRQLCLVLWMTWNAVGFSQEGMSNGDELHQATLSIYERMRAVQPCIVCQLSIYAFKNHNLRLVIT